MKWEKMSETWSEYYEKYFKVKKDKVVIKLHDTQTGEYKKSIIIPTVYYPLNSNDFKVFHSDNCEKVTDQTILECFDTIPFQMGHCYTMADSLYRLLKEKGVENVELWAGWLFCAAELPVHHCWVTVNDSLLDIAESFSFFYTDEMVEKYANAKNQIEMRMLVAKRSTEITKMKNSDRCSPVGIPNVSAFYVGSRVSSGLEAKAVYNDMVRKYPDHETIKMVNNSGLNLTQHFSKQMIKE